MKSSILVLAALAFGLSGLQAQTAPAVKVDIKQPKLNPIQTPQFNAGNVPDKNWRPKTWLEVDMEFDIKLPQAAGGRNGSLPSSLAFSKTCVYTVARLGGLGGPVQCLCFLSEQYWNKIYRTDCQGIFSVSVEYFCITFL